MEQKESGGIEKRAHASGIKTAADLFRHLKGGNSEIDAENLIVQIIFHLGGVDQFAKKIAEILSQKGVPASAKVRTLDMVANFVKYYTESQLLNRVNLDELSLADLEKVARAYFRDEKLEETSY